MEAVWSFPVVSGAERSGVGFVNDETENGKQFTREIEEMDRCCLCLRAPPLLSVIPLSIIRILRFSLHSFASLLPLCRFPNFLLFIPPSLSFLRNSSLHRSYLLFSFLLDFLFFGAMTFIITPPRCYYFDPPLFHHSYFHSLLLHLSLPPSFHIHSLYFSYPLFLPSSSFFLNPFSFVFSPYSTDKLLFTRIISYFPLLQYRLSTLGLSTLLVFHNFLSGLLLPPHFFSISFLSPTVSFLSLFILPLFHFRPLFSLSSIPPFFPPSLCFLRDR